MLPIVWCGKTNSRQVFQITQHYTQAQKLKRLIQYNEIITINKWSLSTAAF